MTGYAELMIDELTKRQRDLDDIALRFQQFRSFVVELRKTTKGKPFDPRSLLAWEAILSLNRMIVIDLQSWVDSLHSAWLGRHLQGETLRKLRTSKTLARRLAERSGQLAMIPAPASPEDRLVAERALRTHREAQILRSRREALRCLFGTLAAERGHARAEDVLRLVEKVKRWSENLTKLRNMLAHRYGLKTATTSVKLLRPQDIARRILYCARLMNDLRLLIDNSTYGSPHVVPGRFRNLMVQDLIDIILTGPIQSAVAEWNKEEGVHPWQKRDAYYRRLHVRRRESKRSSFNRETYDPILRPAKT
jgi:hypothetical protein